MKALLLASLLMISPISFANDDAILGLWQYTAYLFEGNRLPAPNPDLVLTFDFGVDGVSRLKWYRKNEEGFCERLAHYIAQGPLLYQKTYWINPENHSSCSSDPDMQANKESMTRFEVTNNEVHLYFDLDGKPFIYILTRVSSF